MVVRAISTMANGIRFSFAPMVNDFNAYAKEKGLNIKLDLILFTSENSTIEVKDYEAQLDSIFSRRSNKYEIIFFDNIYTSKFGPHLLDLRELNIPKEHLDMYLDGIASRTCVHNNRVVGLVIIIIIIILIIILLYLFIYLFIKKKNNLKFFSQRQ